ncbi:MAG: hypothetical protein GY830_03955 [Bacteroidetes bacterium]|nr:hypothetical protein [Bacteroidota bacterium]
MTKAFPMLTSDMIQLDGINYSPIISDQLAQSLVAAEIAEETSKITGATDILELSVVAADSLAKYKAIKQKIANYLAINSTNED